MLTAGEPAWLAALAAGGPGELPETCLHELFERQARRIPDAIAAREAGPGGPDTGLTYAELDARADRIARALTARGVGPETWVAVHLHRSADLVAALLGVARRRRVRAARPRLPPSRGCGTSWRTAAPPSCSPSPA
ncbi:AMP-binding protein [Streptomyces sp. BB1-1-1]|uniref:AMP-binding protein n=1 Tax=Streptomyces sp. BB1-1-1 TaxID=3074430 RepID=UPI002877EC45|nr:AMP-binding protein [Streptomyces sp. BB1-1-1]WND40143.1 AMP-binding protein [Streptomyces sp. BB1-1-1]